MPDAAAGRTAFKVNSLTDLDTASPVEGEVLWDPGRSLWNSGFLVAALVLGPLTFSWSAFAIFLGLSAVTLCAGHSVGFHRRLIHRSFECPKWLERMMVYLGTLVGMGGPVWTIGLHDSRDWAQREADCHWFLRHGKPLWIEGFYYLNFKLKLKHPPGFDPGPGIGDDPFYNFLQRTWMAHQIPRRRDPLPARRLGLGGVGSRRPGRRLHDHALVHLLFRPQPRPAGLDPRWRRAPGL